MVTALIIEDSIQMAESLSKMLSLMGIEAATALTPRLAFKMIEEQMPQVVFLDVNLPTVDGFEILAYIRRDPRMVDLPVIIVTSNDQPETYKKAKAGNALTVIIKPASYTAVEEALRKINLLPA
jgi:chemosensory pili system protein ChpA (sensor histidine kinase/response regulator)